MKICVLCCVWKSTVRKKKQQFPVKIADVQVHISRPINIHNYVYKYNYYAYYPYKLQNISFLLYNEILNYVK